MTISELVERLRSQIGDDSESDYLLTDKELINILNNSASEYSRIKGYIKIDESNTYDEKQNVYTLPDDCYKVKDIVLKNAGNKFKFIDNIDQVYLLNEFNVQNDILKITYTKYFKPEEILEKEIDIYFLHAEALCYKLLASKSADLIRFSTGEKMVDESGISKKYLDLYKATNQDFKNKLIKAYGKRAYNIKDDLNYRIPYPPEGETP